MDDPVCPPPAPLEGPEAPDGLLEWDAAPPEGDDVGDPLLPPVYPVGPLPTKVPEVEAVVNRPEPVATKPPVPSTV